MRKFFYRWTLLAIMSCGIFCNAYAQNFPNKTIRIIVPFGAGGLADLSARIVAQKLSEQLSQSVVVENYPGAGGVVAAGIVAKANPDGYTLLLMSNANAISATLFKKLPHDNAKDFIPITTLGFFDLVVFTGSQSRYKNLQEFLDAAKASPGELNLATINVGSTQNLTGELFKEQSKSNIQVVPFNGTPAVISAVRGGQVDIGVDILGPILPQINSGAIRVLALTGAERSPFLPGSPTAKELGIKDFTVTAWNALAAPSKTPPAVVATLNKAIVAAVNSPDVQARFKEIGMEPKTTSVDEFQKFFAQEIVKWGAIINKANIPKQ